ncbi:adenosylcobinamide-GDP ribazoletransferase [Chloroflexota bacterium]
MSLLAALSFLTTIPIPYKGKISSEDLGRSTLYFPLVGLIIGLILVGLNWLLTLFLPSTIVNGLIIVSLVIISGALHLDGFVDTCDGIAGHKTVEDRWLVMHDSRAGAFGIIGVFLLLLVKYISLNSLPGDLMIMTLVLVPLIGRWTMVYAIFAYPYARPVGLGKVFKEGTNWQSLVIATVGMLVVALAIVWIAKVSYFYLVALAVILIPWVIIVLLAKYLKQKFSGLTGDTYGMINEVAEVGVLVMISLLAYNGFI